jgi:hypothetical protein
VVREEGGCLAWCHLWTAWLERLRPPPVARVRERGAVGRGSGAGGWAPAIVRVVQEEEASR